jgi:hypothetical protein
LSFAGKCVRFSGFSLARSGSAQFDFHFEALGLPGVISVESRARRHGCFSLRAVGFRAAVRFVSLHMRRHSGFQSRELGLFAVAAAQVLFLRVISFPSSVRVWIWVCAMDSSKSSTAIPCRLAPRSCVDSSFRRRRRPDFGSALRRTRVRRRRRSHSRFLPQAPPSGFDLHFSRARVASRISPASAPPRAVVLRHRCLDFCFQSSFCFSRRFSIHQFLGAQFVPAESWLWISPPVRAWASYNSRSVVAAAGLTFLIIDCSECGLDACR